MRTITKILTAALGCVALSLVGGIAWSMHEKYEEEQVRVRELEEQLAILSKKEKQAVVMQSVNAQMEEIATQQRIISDEQREEAEQQARIANDMRLHAEQERLNAQEAEKRALDASEVAKGQRVIAENQRVQAEYAKRVADTLSILAMARNVGNAAITQQRTGNREIANLLAYASYTFTQRYHGDTYHPSIYEAMTLTSGGQRKWAVAHGSIMKLYGIPGSDSFMTISKYGEILKHTKTGNDLQTKTIFSDKNYDIRDIYINNERTFYAVSHTGHLIVSKENGKIHIVPIEGAYRPFRIYSYGHELVITAEQSIHVIDATTLRPVKTLPLSFKTSVAGKKNDQIVLFDQTGDMYLLSKDISKVTRQNLPFKGRVMSYNHNLHTNQQAFGMYDGTIYYIDPAGNLHKLVGHNSRVTRIVYDKSRIYSCSYDGTVRYWNTTSEKIEPITILNSKQWIICLSFDKSSRNIWTGDQHGNLTETLVDIPEMAKRLKASLKRDLTREEWNYYIGRSIPYETFKGKEARP